MALRDLYHFHKDCKYYPQCTEEIVKKGKQELIKFTCPALKYSQLYYKGDIHTIKWDCLKFEPYQPNFLDSTDNQ